MPMATSNPNPAGQVSRRVCPWMQAATVRQSLDMRAIEPCRQPGIRVFFNREVIVLAISFRDKKKRSGIFGKEYRTLHNCRQMSSRSHDSHGHRDYWCGNLAAQAAAAFADDPKIWYSLIGKRGSCGEGYPPLGRPALAGGCASCSCSGPCSISC